MSLRASYQKYSLRFQFEAGTSRGILTERDSYFVRVFDTQRPGAFGLGECSPLKGLSPDDRPDFELHLSEICDALGEITSHAYAWDVGTVVRELVGNEFPAIQFGVETALLDWVHGGRRIIFDNAFAHGEQAIAINGLIWMGHEAWMRQQLEAKLHDGYQCLKMKIGAIAFEQEYRLLADIRQRYSPQQITLRVDANGAFTAEEAPEKLRVLAQLGLHSIEQPIRAGQPDAMRRLCQQTPLPIALDEELIGITEYSAKEALLAHIQPQFIILKPTLLGGFEHCREWIHLAEQRGIGWWMTSALESNVGLNAIAQFTAEFAPSVPQGLGTGQLYTNNLESPLEIDRGTLQLNLNRAWNLHPIEGRWRE